jgi:anoctamin-7
VTFLKHWKQKNAEITHQWDLMEFEEEEVSFSVIEKADLIVYQNRPRPEFAIRSSTVEKNPVTGILEPYFPAATRRYRIITGVLILSVMVTKKISFFSYNILIEDLHCYHIYPRDHNLSNNHQYSIISKFRFTVKNVAINSNESLFFVFRQYALTIASISGAVINLIIIMILGRLYEIIAYKLTQWGLFSWGRKRKN